MQVHQFVAGFSLEAGLPPLNSLVVWKAPFCALSHHSIQGGQTAVPDLDLQQLVWLPSCAEACPLMHVSSAGIHPEGGAEPVEGASGMHQAGTRHK